MTMRDETGKFVALTEEQKLERQIAELQAKLAEAKRVEAEKAIAAKKKAEEEKSLVRKADVDEIQKLANAYLKEVEENKKIRAELAKKEKDLYDSYQAKLKEFGNKHNGYHLTYVTKDGKTVEFKVEVARADEFEQKYREELERIKAFWNNWINN